MRKGTMLSLLVCLIALPARAGLVTQTQWVVEQPTDWTETLRFDPIPDGVDSIHLSATGRLNHRVDALPPDVTLTLGPSSIVSPYFDFEFPAVERGLGDLSPVSFVASAVADIPVLPGPFDFTTFAQSFSSFVAPTGNGTGTTITTAALDVTIEYQAPISIPEPASLVLLGIGAVAVMKPRILLRRNRVSDID